MIRLPTPFERSFEPGIKIIDQVFEIFLLNILSENLQKWLREMAQQVESLNFEEGIASGRKMAHLIQALEEVQGTYFLIRSVLLVLIFRSQQFLLSNESTHFCCELIVVIRLDL